MSGLFLGLASFRTYCLEPTDLPWRLSMWPITPEQIARGYLTGANSNRWHHHVFGYTQNPKDSNVITYFYCFEFQSRGTLHLHMLVWVKDLSLIRANLFRTSIPQGNANDPLLVADTQKSSSSFLTLSNSPDSFIVRPDGTTHEDADRNLRAYFTTLLGALHCRTSGRWQGHALQVSLPMLRKCTSQLPVRACIAATLLAIRQQMPFSEQCVC